jgi:DNA-binding transcriptional LysR family regulator
MLSQQSLTFLAVANHGSFSKAAKVLYLSPVSVMKQMNNFENEIGVLLLNRSKSGIKLTPAGQILYSKLSQLKVDADNILKSIRALKSDDSIPIRVGTSVLRSCSPIVELWSQPAAQKYHFQIEIVPLLDDQKSLQRNLNLLGNQIDCLVSPYGVNQVEENYQIQPLGEYACQIGVPTQHPLSKKAVLTWHDLDHQDLLLLERGQSTIIDQIRNEINNQHPDIQIHDLPDFYNLNSFNYSVQNNTLIEIIEPWKNVHPSITAVPMQWSYKIPYGLIFASTPSNEVLDFIHATKALKSLV